ncbi:nogo-B receptor-like, partial [Tropilaelaps mercedesae]
VQSILNAGEEYKKNVPKHICLAILEEKLNFEDISRMAVWCHALGAKYISFFDPLGTLMGSSKVLEEELKKKFFECRIPKDEMVFLQPGEKFNSLNVDNDATVARILDVKDGQKKAGDVISSILNDAISNKENPLSNVNEFSVLDIEARLIGKLLCII